MSDRPGGMQIPISVVGDEKAKADLKAVEQAAVQAQAATQKGAAGVSSFRAETQGLAAKMMAELAAVTAQNGPSEKLAVDFNAAAAAVRHVTTAVGGATAEFGAAAVSASTVATGAGLALAPTIALSAALLAIPAAINAIIDGFVALGAEADRRAAIEKARRDTGVKDASTLSDRLGAVGLAGPAGAVAMDMQALADKGLTRSRAENVAAARRLMAAEGRDFDEAGFIAGMFARGGKPIDLLPKEGTPQDEIAKVIADGASPDRRAFAERRLADDRQQALREAAEHPPDAMYPTRDTLVDTALLRMRSRNPRITPDDEEDIRALLRLGSLRNEAGTPLQQLVGSTNISAVGPSGFAQTRSISGGETLQSALTASREVDEQLAAQVARPDATPVTAPIIQQNTFIAAQYNGRPATPIEQSYDAFGGQ